MVEFKRLLTEPRGRTPELLPLKEGEALGAATTTGLPNTSRRMAFEQEDGEISEGDSLPLRHRTMR